MPKGKELRLIYLHILSEPGKIQELNKQENALNIVIYIKTDLDNKMKTVKKTV